MHPCASGCLYSINFLDLRSTHDNRHVWASSNHVMKSILIADDNRFLRRCIHQALDQEPDFEVCGEAENGQQAIEMTERLRPDAVLLDLVMPVMNGLDAAREISRAQPHTRLVLFSGYVSELTHSEVQSAGFAAQVCKGENIAALVGKTRDLFCSTDLPGKSGPS